MYSERQMQMDPYKLTIQREIDRWDEGIPLGNGELGALVFGSAKKLTVSLDRGDIWDESGSPENTPGFCYANLVKWAKSGNRKAIYKTFDLPYQRPTPTKLPCGRLELFVQGDRVPQDCCFALDLKTAVCTFTNGDFRLAAFVHAAQGVGVLKTEGAPVKIHLVRPKFGKRTKYSAFFERFSRRAAVSNKLKNVKYPEPVLKHPFVQDVRVQLFIQPLNDGSAFGVAVGERQTACGQEFAFYAYSGRGEAPLENILTEKVTDALQKGYDALFPSHRAWWRAYNARSEICVPDDYIQSRYNMGNYLLGSASRKGNFPMPLQGLWTACDDKYLPPWKGDYHHDLNTELTYLSFLKANRLEQGECFLDYLASLTERGRDFARNFYDADGICLPAVMDIDGYALGGWPMYSLSPTNQLWLCQSFERCYAYTGDVEFLRKTAYPFIEQSARCILSLLQEDAEGFYVLPVSSSPEIHDNTQKSFLTPNSNYDQALLLYTFSCLARLADVLGKADDRRLWEATLQKLRPLAVNAAHVLRLSRDEDLRESHRHQSHAMAIYPLRLLDYARPKDAEIIDATLQYTASLGSKAYTGYSFAWLAALYAAAKNGEKALEYLEIFWRYFCSVNTFHLNGDYTKQGYSDLTYRPFTLEGNFCALDALQEMLLYAENGVLELFPAVPSAWRDVSFRTLRAWGGVLVSAERRGGKLLRAAFTAENDVSFLLRGTVQDLRFTGGESEPTENGMLITLKKGETLSIQTENDA